MPGARVREQRPSLKAADVFPLAWNGRHLVNVRGEPYLVSWFRQDRLAERFTHEQARARYLAYPAINGWVVRAVESAPNDESYDNAYGEQPFNSLLGGGEPNLTDPNDAYFDRLVAFANMLRADGRLLGIRVPLYSGHEGAGNGWAPELMAGITNAHCETFGQYMGRKFRNCPNVVWVYFGDSAHATIEARNAAFRTGLVATDRHDRLYYVHLYSGSTSNNLSRGGLAGWTAYDGPTGGGKGLLTIYTLRNEPGPDGPKTYNYYPAAHALEAYNANSSGPPMIDIEPAGEGNTDDARLGADFRTIIYELYLSGAWCGYLHRLEGGFADEDTDDSTGLRDLERVMQLLRSVAWHTLAPSTSGLVTAGGGTAGSANYVVRAFNGSTLAILRTRNGASFTVNRALFSGTITARWYDPTNGTFTAATGSPMANTGTHAFVASSERGNNSAGETDWVLLLEAA